MKAYEASTNGPFYYGKPYSTKEITDKAMTVQTMHDAFADRYLVNEEPVLLSMIAENGGPQSPEEQRLVENLHKDIAWMSNFA